MDLSIALGLVGLVWFFGTAEIRRINFVTGDLATNGSINKDYLSNENNQPKIPLAIIASDLFNISSDSSLAAIKHTSSLSEIMVLPQIGPDTNLGQSGNILDLLKKTASQNHNTVLVSLDHQVHGDTIREDHVYSPSGDFHAERSMVSSNEYSFLSSKSLPDSLKQWFFLNNENGPPSQNLSTIAKINWGKVAILGGSEINNSQLVANDVRHGASLIVFQSNIDWARNKCLGKQLLAAAIMRAVENNRHVIVSAGNSVMAIIEPTGLVRSLCLSQYKSDQSTGEKSGIILSTVQFLWSKTPFTKMWWL